MTLVVEQAESRPAEAERREGRFMEARGLVGGNRHAILDDKQFGRVGRDFVFRQTDALAGGERAAEAGLREFFRDRLPS